MKMCQALAQAGHEVTLVGRVGKERMKDLHGYYAVDPCFAVTACPASERMGFAVGVLHYMAASVRRVWAMPRPDLLYSRSYECLVALSPFRIPFVLEAHGSPSTRFMRHAIGWLLHRKGFVRLVVITHALREEFLRLYPGLTHDRITVAPDGADPPPAGDGCGACPTFQHREGAVQVGYVGSLGPGKGLEVIVPLAREVEEADFHVVGGSEASRREWAERARGVRNLHFHGYVPPFLTNGWRRAMDILTVPNQRSVLYRRASGRHGDIGSWTSPLKVFEAMAAGKPIVASDLPVLREVLEDGDNAMLVPADSVDAWAQAVRSLANDPGERERLGGSARRQLEARYTWQVRAGRILASLPSGFLRQ